MSKNLKNFYKTYSYHELIKNHSENEDSVWEIRGEDPNCDNGWSHYKPYNKPYLATVTGKLKDVIEVAVEIRGFWQWGAGGSIQEVKIQSLKQLQDKVKVIRK